MRLDFLKIESYKRGIMFSSLFNLISKGLMFFSNLVIAYYFGTQDKTDVYFYAFATITLLATFVTSSDASVLIPESMRLNEQIGRKESMDFLNFFFYIYLGIGLLTTIFLLVDPVNRFSFISSFHKIVLRENSKILIFSVPLLTLMLINIFFVDILISYKYFTLPMIVGMINSLCVLLFIYLFNKSLNVLSILIGVTCAYIINIIILYFLMKRNLNWEFKLRPVRISKNVWKNILFSQTGNITTALCGFVPVFMFSGFNVGIITALNFGQKTAEFPNQIVTGQFSTVLGIKFNELNATKNFAKMNEIFVSSAKFLLFILVPISFFVFLYSKEIIILLFKRGQFNDASVVMTSEFLKYLAILLPMLALNTLVSRLFMSLQKIKEGFYYQVIMNMLLIPLVFLGIKFFGIKGYLCSMIIMYTLSVFAIFELKKLYFPDINYKKVFDYFIFILTINLCIAVLVSLGKEFLRNQNIILRLGIGFILYSAILSIFNILFKVNDDLNKIIPLVIYKIKRSLSIKVT